MLSVIDWVNREPALKREAKVSPVIASNREKVLKIIRDRGPIVARQISEALNGELKPSTLLGKDYLKHFMETGVIKNLDKMDRNRRRGYYDPAIFTPST